MSKSGPKVSLGTRIKHFFLAPADAGTWRRVMPFVVLGVLTLVVATGAVAGWGYTNSNSFCGTTCHTMPPQYSTYLQSEHSRVECVECHLGRDNLDIQVGRKIQHSDTLIALVFHTYEYPIVAKKMRPANEACETCHFPQQFSDDTLKEVRQYNADENNTYQSIFLLLKTGGGTKRQGLGQGIHWHIENDVTFLATDPLEQNIPYIRVVDDSGKVTEYTDVTSGIDPKTVDPSKLKSVDCITCHNRVSHEIPSPEMAVEQAITKGLIPSDLPFAYKQAVDLLTVDYANKDAAFAAFDGLKTYYSEQYPKIYSEQPEKIDLAIATIKSIYPSLRYPEQKLDWTSHPDNTGHTDSAGCFRCHDGKHLSADGQAIRLECNLCHSVPTVTDPTKFVTNIELVRGPEPSSHTNTNWMTLHGKVIDPTCAGCHPPTDPATDLTKLTAKPPADGSFCGNSACHSQDWKYADLNNPAVTKILDQQIQALKQVAAEPVAPPAGQTATYENALKPLFDSRCGSCHTGAKAMAGMDLSSYATIVKGNKDGAGIIPGDPEASLIYKIQSAGGHFGQLAQSEVDELKAWIQAGAPEK